MKKNDRTILKVAATSVVVASVCAAAVSFAVADSPAQGDAYVSNAACLECHGGSQAALEAITDGLGDSNPHGGTHGSGGIACNVCHQSGMQTPTAEENICLDCHAWPRPEQSLLPYMNI